MKDNFSRYLIETDALESSLHDPDLRVLDCTVLLQPDADGNMTNAGREAWIKGHIPGSGFVDIAKELSNPKHDLPLMMPTAEQFTEVMSKNGIEHGKKVVLYDSCSDKWAHIWAARVWWMLRVFGFEDAAILNGGWHKWTTEKRSVSADAAPVRPAKFTCSPRPELIADKNQVLSAIGNEQTCLINALTAEEHAGTKARYGRPGHIPSSVNVPTVSLIDPTTRTYLPMDQLHQRFKTVGSFDKEKVIIYCGGGIAASSDAFVLTLLGKENVAVYDGSLMEWASDQTLPMEMN